MIHICNSYAMEISFSMPTAMSWVVHCESVNLSVGCSRTFSFYFRGIFQWSNNTVRKVKRQLKSTQGEFSKEVNLVVTPKVLVSISRLHLLLIRGSHKILDMVTVFYMEMLSTDSTRYNSAYD